MCNTLNWTVGSVGSAARLNYSVVARLSVTTTVKARETVHNRGLQRENNNKIHEKFNAGVESSPAAVLVWTFPSR